MRVFAELVAEGKRAPEGWRLDELILQEDGNTGKADHKQQANSVANEEPLASVLLSLCPTKAAKGGALRVTPDDTPSLYSES